MRVTLIVPFIIMCLAQHCISQDTWSKYYNFDEFIDNNYFDITLYDDTLYVAIGHICSDQKACYTISQVSEDGNLNSVFLSGSDHLIANGKCLLVTDSILYVSQQYTANDLSGTRITKHDKHSNEIEIFDYPIDLDTSFVSDGFISTESNLFVFGSKTVKGTMYTEVLIFKFNKDGTRLLDTYTYVEGDLQNICDVMSLTPEGNLIFRNHYKKTGDQNSMVLTTIDTMGRILDKHYFKDLGSVFALESLEVSKNGIVYFTSSLDILEHNSPIEGREQLGLIYPEEDTISRDSSLPSSYTFRTYDYEIYGITALSDGDIVMCGTVRYLNNIWPMEEGDQYSLQSAFNARATADGEFLWMRRYNVKSESTNVDFSRAVGLEKIIELDDGHLVVAGQTIDYLPNLTPKERELWLLKVDANGCLEGEECGEVIWIDGKDEAWYDPVFEIGDAWTYDWEESPDINNFDNGTITYTVVDTITEDDRLINLIEADRPGHDLKMWQDWDKIYFYNPQADDYELHYNFNLNHAYETTITDCNGSKKLSVSLDGATEDYFYDMGLEYTYHIDLIDVDSQDTLTSGDIIRGIGSTYGGLRLVPDTTCLTYPRAGDLRCLTAHDRGMNRQPYELFPDGFHPPSCDTVYVSSLSEVQTRKLSVHPNPTSGELTIELPEILSGRLYVKSLTGQVVFTQEIDYSEQISLDLYGQESGMYLVEVVSESGERFLERVFLY